MNGTYERGTRPSSFEKASSHPNILSRTLCYCKEALSDTWKRLSALFQSIVSPQEDVLTALNYNIDTNAVRTEEGFARDAFPEWRAHNRMIYLTNTIGDIIEAKHPDIIQLQETRKFTTKFGDQVDSVTKLVKFLQAQGYIALVQPYNETGEKAFQFISAFDPKKFVLKRSFIKYLTKSPDRPTPRPSTDGKNQDEVKKIQADIREHNFGAEWERGVFILELENLTTRETVYSINVHLDINADCRIKTTELLTQFVQEIVQQNPHAKVLISGDFNTIPNWGDERQLAILHQANVKNEPLIQEASKEIKLEDGSIASFSFIAFPYDFASNEKRLNLSEVLNKMPPRERRMEVLRVFDKECDALGGKLDRVFSRGFEHSEVELIPAVVEQTCLPSYHEADVKRYIVRQAQNENKPAFASDHQPLVITLRARKTAK